MRHVSRNADGSVEVWGTLPSAIVRDSDGAVLRVLGVRRRAGLCWLYGEFTAAGKPPVGAEVAVGDEWFDPADLDALPGHTVHFPDFERDILGKKHPDSPKAVAHRRVTRGDLIASGLWAVDPRSKLLCADHTFRAAWRDRGNLEVDMPHAREIHRERIRRARVPLLEALDVEYQRADEQGDQQKKKEVAAAKQKLRDATADPRIDAAQSPAELVAVWPLPG